MKKKKNKTTEDILFNLLIDTVPAKKNGYNGDIIDSNWNLSQADAVRELAGLGRLEIITEMGSRIKARIIR